MDGHVGYTCLGTNSEPVDLGCLLGHIVHWFLVLCGLIRGASGCDPRLQSPARSGELGWPGFALHCVRRLLARQAVGQFHAMAATGGSVDLGGSAGVYWRSAGQLQQAADLARRNKSNETFLA